MNGKNLMYAAGVVLLSVAVAVIGTPGAAAFGVGLIGFTLGVEVSRDDALSCALGAVAVIGLIIGAGLPPIWWAFVILVVLGGLFGRTRGFFARDLPF